jgi:hypothetical protein
MSAAEKKHAPEECPVCGAKVPPGAKACPECGADERSGWNEEETRYDGLDLPEENFTDREERLEDEGLKRRVTPKGVSLFWWAVGVGLTLWLVYHLVFIRG